MANKNSENLTIEIPTHRIERQAWVEMPLPNSQALARFFGWALGRIALALMVFAVNSAKIILKIGIHCCDAADKGLKKILATYDALPTMGVPLQSVVAEVATPAPGIQDVKTVDLLESIAGKHCFILGDTGTGKSTLAQWLAYQVGGEVTVYDSDAAPEEWRGLKVVGRKGNLQAIRAAMVADLEELERRIELRGEYGDKALNGLDSTTIAEEFPLLASEIDIAGEWMIKHGNRGRKPKRLIIALSQDDSVKTLNIEGQGNARKNFRYVRLGKYAVTHARSLKDDALVAWLQAGKYRCMVDDDPCQLPDLRGYNAVTTRLLTPIANAPTETAETSAQSDISPPVTKIRGDEIKLKNAVKALLQAGWSESKIIKDVLNYRGSQYADGKKIFDNLLE